MKRKIIVVDENNNVTGAKYFEDAIEDGDIRRASRVFVFDTNGNLLIQKRSVNVRRPLLLDQSVGGHIDEGETAYEAAEREMQEELGLKGYHLELIEDAFRTKEFFNSIYKTVIPTNIEVSFDPEEIDSVHWLTPQKIDKKITDNPELFSKSFIEMWTVFKNKLVE